MKIIITSIKETDLKTGYSHDIPNIVDMVSVNFTRFSLTR